MSFLASHFGLFAHQRGMPDTAAVLNNSTGIPSDNYEDGEIVLESLPPLRTESRKSIPFKNRGDNNDRDDVISRYRYPKLSLFFNGVDYGMNTYSLDYYAASLLLLPFTNSDVNLFTHMLRGIGAGILYSHNVATLKRSRSLVVLFDPALHSTLDCMFLLGEYVGNCMMSQFIAYRVTGTLPGMRSLVLDSLIYAVFFAATESVVTALKRRNKCVRKE